MEIQQNIDLKKTIQSNLLEFIDDESSIEENYHNLITLFNVQKIQENPDELQSVLYLILKIANNHHRSPTFFSKIEKILLFFKDSIKENLTNKRIFAIFKSNKRILLFLMKEEILIPDSSIAYKMTEVKYQKRGYLHYFYPEIKSFLNDCEIDQFEVEDFEEKREIGENDDELCELIRKDLIEDFITYVNKKSFSLKTTIKKSFFETNSFLLKMTPSFFEYSAFFGSFQIFKYFHLNGNVLSPSLWLYAVHGDNPELIQYLVENKVKPNDESYKEVVKESIKCHHNEIVNYIYYNILNDQIENNKDAAIQSIKYSNYDFFPNDLKNETYFYYLCEYDNLSLVNLLLKVAKINIKEKVIFLY